MVLSPPLRWMLRACVAVAIAVPTLIAAQSPLLQWRDPIYIAAGFAGIAALGLLLVQPLLSMRGVLISHPLRTRRVHRWVGITLVALVVAHIAGLWITSPPDVIDALLFASPTPFSIWGVSAMWALFFTAVLARFRRRLRLRIWQILHALFAIVLVWGTIAHAVLITGTMGQGTKVALCALVAFATLMSLVVLKRRS